MAVDVDDLNENWTPKQVAQHIGIDPARVVRMLASGELKGGWRAGRVWRVPKQAILDYVSSQQRRVVAQRTQAKAQ